MKTFILIDLLNLSAHKLCLVVYLIFISATLEAETQTLLDPICIWDDLIKVNIEPKVQGKREYQSEPCGDHI